MPTNSRTSRDLIPSVVRSLHQQFGQARAVTILQAALPPILSALKDYLPLLAKYLLYLVFLVNVKSWPLGWHFRIFRPVFLIRLQYRWLKLRTIFRPRAAREAEEEKWANSLSPVGLNPMLLSVPFYTRATFDEIDFMGHLSNSSYAKNCDAARFKAAVAMFPHFFRAGGWMALSATHYHFLHEIPKFAKYEIRTSIGGWDQKWLYVIGRFITKKDPKKLKNKQYTGSARGHRDTSNKPLPAPPSEPSPFTANLHTPAHHDELFSSNSASESVTPSGSTPQPNETARSLEAVAAELIPGYEEDPSVIVHTISVHQTCFKIGRITVPPAVVLACNGFTVPPPPSSDSTASYSLSRPPPHWENVQNLMAKSKGGSIKKLRQLMQHGWKEAPAGERFWETALGGIVEERRKRNMVAMEELRSGLTGAKLA